MERSLRLTEQGNCRPTHAIVFLIEYPRDPALRSPGAAWITGIAGVGERHCAAQRPPRYLQTMCESSATNACGHSATTSDVNLHRLAVSAGSP